MTLLGVGGAFSLAYAGLPELLSVSYTQPSLVASSTQATPGAPEKPKTVHLERPVPLKGIYMSQCVAGTPSFRDSLVKFIDETELNAVVIDIKDYSGKIAFPTDNALLKNSVSDICGANDMRSFVALLHKKQIYVIGRITVFQDPYYTSQHPELAVQKKSGGMWKDNKGLAFVDVGARPFWDYIVELGKISYELGFDELNFDYVRYPSDGPMLEAVYAHSDSTSKPEMLERFFSYLTQALRPTGAVLSADLFGMTTTNEDDLNIGQVLERTMPYFDGIYPMVYPSHYPSGFHGYKNVNENTYGIVKYSMDAAVMRTVATSTRIAGIAFSPIASTSPQLYAKPSYQKSKMVPWLQSFDYPVYYSPEMVQAQIQAAYDAGLDSWIFWDAGNKYTSLRKVLAPVSSETSNRGEPQ